METNALPFYDTSDNPTGCCPRFKPETWDGLTLHLRDKPFVRAATKSVLHIPMNMGSTFTRVFEHMKDAGAYDEANFVVMSRDLSPWTAEHLFAADTPVKHEEMTTLSGDFITKVFEGSFREAKDWHAQMQDLAEKQGTKDAVVWFFYTTCPRCAKTYGKNYVVGLAQL
ncbi:hydrolase [uncultured Aliiroseovarius sp.]|uniref:hydrolase n=1 Tax=uncultured Aliiroseovarius sp. TaxID=1658783 RepID=UPI0026192EDD|nr:hydrolase [uncultured Aliiroseovarius sp.]